MRTDYMWAVGLFEGEGCIFITYPKDRVRPRVGMELSSTDEDVVARFAAAMGGGPTYGPRQKKAGWKPSWTWRITHPKQVEPLLREMHPHLGLRRADKAAEALAVLSAHYP